MNREAHTDRSDGFTLLEMVAVLGVIALLSGIGFGFLNQHKNQLEVAMAVVRDKVRLAHETARNTGRPTTVELIVRRDGNEVIGQALRAKVLSTVGQWHLEPDEQPYAGLVPVLAGKPDPNGRFGACLRPDPDKGAAMFSLQTAQESRFRMIDGFALRMEVYLESRQKCVVATFGSTFTLELDSELRPQASMFLAEGRGRGPQVRIDTTDGELPLDRWVTLEILHDGRMFQLLVDGQPVGEQSARGEPYQSPQGSLFEVSPVQGLVPGRVDEIQLMAYEQGEVAELPPEVDVRGLGEPIAYDRYGRLRRPVTLEFRFGERTTNRQIAPGGVLQ